MRSKSLIQAECIQWCHDYQYLSVVRVFNIWLFLSLSLIFKIAHEFCIYSSNKCVWKTGHFFSCSALSQFMRKIFVNSQCAEVKYISTQHTVSKGPLSNICKYHTCQFGKSAVSPKNKFETRKQCCLHPLDTWLAYFQNICPNLQKWDYKPLG